MRMFAYLLAILLVAPLCTARAQDQPAPVEPGDRVRVWVCAPTRPCERMVGTLLAVKAGHLALEQGEAGPTSVLFESIWELEVQRGWKSAVWRNAALGGFVLGTLSFAITMMSTSECSGESIVQLFCGLSGSDVARATVVGAALGAGVGALSGLGTRSEKWEHVPLDELSVSVVPRSDGVALGISVAF